MIKKIAVDLLRPGMFIHDLNCNWLDHPFLGSRFVLRSEKAIQRIAKVGIREVYIDTDRGLDAPDAQSAHEVHREIECELNRVADTPAATAKPLATSLPVELHQARRVRQEASRVLTDVMADARLGRQIERERVDHVVDRMVASILRNKDALLSLGRIRHMDQYTFEHSVSVGALMIAFARELGLEPAQIHEVGVGALLHDVGKIHIPDTILNKPGRLTDDEFALMRGHVTHSRDILREAPGISATALAVAAQHHERFDGTGYPDGLAGDAISRYGQMAAIVDVYDAITADRCYHKGEPPTSVLGKLLEWSRFHFSPQLVQQFVRCVGIYPVGTLVRLESGRLAAVIQSGEKGLLHPMVRVFYDSRTRHYISPRDLDLSAPSASGGERIVGFEDPKAWGIDLLQFMPG